MVFIFKQTRKKSEETPEHTKQKLFCTIEKRGLMQKQENETKPEQSEKMEINEIRKKQQKIYHRTTEQCKEYRECSAARG